MSGKQIPEDVPLRGADLPHPVVVHDCLFEGEVDFRNARCEAGLDLSGCKFARTLALADARVKGALVLDRIELPVASSRGVSPRVLASALARLKEDARRTAAAPELASDPGRRRFLLERRLYARIRLRRRMRKAPPSGSGTPAVVLELENARVDGCMSAAYASIGGRLNARHLRVDGDLSLDGAWIGGDLVLRHALLGELRTEPRSEGRDTSRGTPRPFRVAGSLDCGSATVSSDLLLSGAVVGGDLVGTGLTVDGSFRWRPGNGFRSRVRGTVLLQTMKVRGSFVVEGAHLLGDVNLQGASTGGNLQFAPAGCWRSELGAELWMAAASVSGAVELRGASVAGDVVMQNARIGQGLIARANSGHRTYVGGDAWLLGVSVSGGIDLSGAEVVRNVMLDRARAGNVLARVHDGYPPLFHGDVSMEAMEVDGSVSLLGLDVDGSVEVSGARIGVRLAVAFDLVSTDGWKPRRANVGGRLRAESATIGGGGVLLAGADLGSRRPASAHFPAAERGVSLMGSRINGDVQFYSETHAGDVVRDKHPGASSHEEWRLELARAEAGACGLRTRVWGDLRLTRAYVLGNVALEGVQVLGDLDVRDARVRANVSCRELPVGGGLRAEMWRADFETLDLAGDADLTGLTIRRGLSALPPDLVLREASVRGRLELWPYEPRAGAARARVEGAVHLEAATVSHAVLSGRNLDGNLSPGLRRHHDGPANPRLALERAKIGRFQIEGELPGSVDLSHLHVDRWELGVDGDGAGAAEPRRGLRWWPLRRRDRHPERQRYYDLLECSTPFKRSNYLALEHAVRNAGEEELADRIHVLMRRRDRENRGPLGKIFDWLLERSIGYGTTVKPLLLAMALSFGLCVFVFTDGDRVEWDTLPVADSAARHVKVDEWGWEEAVLLATHYHVPIVSLGVEDHIRPRQLGWRAYAMVITGLSWVMWPLLIASMSGLLRRRE